MLDSGQIIADRYELLKQLGRGGFSEVWLAQDKLFTLSAYMQSEFQQL